MSGRLHVSDTGEGDAALVLLHGFGGTHQVWDGVRAALGPAARILAYDLPGHGGSLAISETGGANAVAAAVLSDLRERGIQRFHLAGHSFGGAVAALMALGEPARVASLTLLAPGGFGPEINATLLRDYAAASTGEELARCLLAMTAGSAPIAREIIVDGLALRSLPGQLAALDRLCAIITRDGRQGVIPRDRLAALAMPVRVLWGGRDSVLPVRQAQDLPPNFVPHIFPDFGHLLPMEAPEEVAQVLRCALA